MILHDELIYLIKFDLMKQKRIHNLDLFRAIAIIFVIIFHVTQMFAGDKIHVNFYIWGRYGVEFFFVLSGFLVGSLYYKQTTSVNLFRFWLLRIFRTYPPYIIALILSYLAVFYARRASFDLIYLIFFQNYYTKIPYFLISWSLCVEEHFYIIFPLLIIILEKIIIRKRNQLFFWIFISLVPTFFRWKFGSNLYSNFGYYETASFFRFDGIAMGCLLSFLIYRLNYKIQFSIFSKAAIFTFFFGMLLLNILLKNTFFTYCFGYMFFNISLFFLLALFYSSDTFKVAKFSFVFPIASMAYSLYLTHALVINFMAMVAAKYHPNIYLTISITIITILIIGFVFFQLIEKPAIRVRNYYFNNNVDQVRINKLHSYLGKSTFIRFFKYKIK